MAQFRRRGWGGALALAVSLAAGAAQAQMPPPTEAPMGMTPAEPPAAPLGPVLTSPFDVSACLCLERAIDSRQAELTVRRNEYEALAHEIADAQATIDRQRPLVDVNNQYAIDDFKRRLDALDALKAQERQVTLPDYQAAIARYNERVAQYTQRCSGHPLDTTVAEQMRATLICQPDQ
jgi:membrane-bound lytic murein transglycosylase B